MFNVIVCGWVPDEEIGEVQYESYVYHVELQDNYPKFLVYNPYLEQFEIVGQSAVKPAVPCTSQNMTTKKKIQAWRTLIEERVNENTESTTT